MEDEASGYSDRPEAGRRLAEALRRELPEPGDAIVLCLPRGGVPVGYEVARALGLPLDLLIVRKLGLPVQPELAMGAVASGGVRVLNPSVVSLADVDEETIEEVEREERAELQRRERAYRGDRPLPGLGGRTVILVDDGVATGSTIRAAIRAVRSREPEKIVAAVPVASPEGVKKLRKDADVVVCPLVPEFFAAIGSWYHDFPQLTDDEVRAILARAWEEEGEGREGSSGDGEGEGAGVGGTPIGEA
ncbi:MAG: phosphoribosyltransferase [Gemmatimonadetes bacterium]|nr:phosphoribosyltransferase [Gemmatimonadota bacterium]NIR77660.1 phosphoribosyltransferase [Gemmatimonadota bacterium]NIT86202.1 phosphoribosyltransferase [Gemmatimonadota bacterium]NIU30027.1 phosphoribosyltransferase [Gemmatimonadota bacterium]NIU34986.1 phosphoribosyltransferase [Gemmatimonadota bacterium]